MLPGIKTKIPLIANTKKKKNLKNYIAWFAHRVGCNYLQWWSDFFLPVITCFFCHLISNISLFVSVSPQRKKDRATCTKCHRLVRFTLVSSSFRFLMPPVKVFFSLLRWISISLLVHFTNAIIGRILFPLISMFPYLVFCFFFFLLLFAIEMRRHKRKKKQAS